MLYLVISGLKAQHRNTMLGYLWWLLDPLLGVAIYFFVVSVVFGRGGADYAITLAIGLTVWRWLHSTVVSGVRSITTQAGIISQVYLPKAIFPLGAAVAQLINFGFGLLVVAIVLLLFKRIPGANVLWLPYIVVVQFLLLAAMALPLAYAAVLVRDMDTLIGHFLRLWFYASPVIWTADTIPVKWRWLIMLNPMAHILEGYRRVLMYNESPDILVLLILGMGSLGLTGFMLLFYSNNEHRLVKSL